MLSHFTHVWLSATQWTVACQAHLSMGFSRQGYWSGLPCPPSGDLPDLGIETMSLMSPVLAGRFFTTSATCEALTLVSVQFSLITQLCLTLCDPMNCKTPGLPVHHQLPEFTQTHVHWVSDTIQPSHPVIPFSSCPQSLPASGSFSNESTLRMRWPKYWSFSFKVSFQFTPLQKEIITLLKG